MKKAFHLLLGPVLAMLLAAAPAEAHDPIFGLGPHVLFQGGIAVSPQLHWGEWGDELDWELSLELAYGITGNWAAGIELPYARREVGPESASGLGNVKLYTKYRFWRLDSLGVQQSAAVLLKLKADTGDDQVNPPLGSGATDSLLGLAYGYESRKWYRWASLRYRFNGENDDGLRRGDRVRFDLVGGYRPKPTSYLEPDTVWLLELNGEYGKREKLNGEQLADTGGTEWILSPGIFWTKRNFAIKAGVQIPIASDMNGNQEASDYRARFVLEWHL